MRLTGCQTEGGGTENRHAFIWFTLQPLIVVLLLCRAVRYRRRYLRDLNFDNIYITAQFRELDELLSSGGGASVLPLTRREANTYITPRQCTCVCVHFVCVKKCVREGLIMCAHTCVCMFECVCV